MARPQLTLIPGGQAGLREPLPVGDRQRMRQPRTPVGHPSRMPGLVVRDLVDALTSWKRNPDGSYTVLFSRPAGRAVEALIYWSQQ